MNAHERLLRAGWEYDADTEQYRYERGAWLTLRTAIAAEQARHMRGARWAGPSAEEMERLSYE